jgi:hypothetical protein
MVHGRGYTGLRRKPWYPRRKQPRAVAKLGRAHRAILRREGSSGYLRRYGSPSWVGRTGPSCGRSICGKGPPAAGISPDTDQEILDAWQAEHARQRLHQ